MSTSTYLVERHQTLRARLIDYFELTKPRIALLELATVAVASIVAGLQSWTLLHVLVGTALVAGSASALNQWLERDRDLLMGRTLRRPLPDGRLREWEVVVFGVVTVFAGVTYLICTVNLLTAGLGLLTWFLYVAVYTPLKTRTPVNTAVGAVAGALPVLMGFSAMGQPIGLKAATMFFIVFLWQFPHFMAISWIYRKDYRAAGFKMLTVVDPSGFRAGVQALANSLMLIPVSLIPVILPNTGSIFIYFGGALILGLIQLAYAVRFRIKPDDVSARHLLLANLVYLPSILMLLLLASPSIGI